MCSDFNLLMSSSPFQARPDDQNVDCLTFASNDMILALELTAMSGVLPIRQLIPRLRLEGGETLSPDLCGLVIWRGIPVPVIDLGSCLGLPHNAHHAHNCVVIVRLGRAANPILMGFRADDLPDIEPMPDWLEGGCALTAAGCWLPLIKGVHHRQEDKALLAWLDLERLSSRIRPSTPLSLERVSTELVRLSTQLQIFVDRWQAHDQID